MNNRELVELHVYNKLPISYGDANDDIYGFIDYDDTFNENGYIIEPREDEFVLIDQNGDVLEYGDSYEELIEYFNANIHAMDCEIIYKEVFELYNVSCWLYKKLASCGEPTIEVDGFCIWGRCTTGQAIYLDTVIDEIVS